MLVETNPGPTDHTQKKIEHKILAFRFITPLKSFKKLRNFNYRRPQVL